MAKRSKTPPAVEEIEIEAEPDAPLEATDLPATGLFSVADFSTLRGADRLELIDLGEQNDIPEASGLTRFHREEWKLLRFQRAIYFFTASTLGEVSCA